MFNVTVLKMKDIKKYLIGIIATAIIVIVASKYHPQTTKEKNAVQKLITQNSMISCLDQAVPTISSINEEYKKIAKEEENTEDSLLQGILKTQISTIQGIENVEEKQRKAKLQANEEQQQIERK